MLHPEPGRGPEGNETLWATPFWAARWKEPHWPYVETLCSPPRSSNTERESKRRNVFAC